MRNAVGKSLTGEKEKEQKPFKIMLTLKKAFKIYVLVLNKTNNPPNNLLGFVLWKDLTDFYLYKIEDILTMSI